MCIIADRCVDVIWNNFTALCRAFDSLNVFASDPVMFFWLFVQFTICLKLWAGYAANAVGDQEAPPHYLDPGTKFVLWWLPASLRFPAIGRESCLSLIQTQRTVMYKKPIKPKSGGCWNMNPVTPRSLFKHHRLQRSSWDVSDADKSGLCSHFLPIKGSIALVLYDHVNPWLRVSVAGKVA